MDEQNKDEEPSYEGGHRIMDVGHYDRKGRWHPMLGSHSILKSARRRKRWNEFKRILKEIFKI